MTMTARRRRAHQRLAALPGVRPVRRPVVARGSAEFDLYYVRTGRKSAHPLVIVPGGPGAASVALYRGLRRRLAAAGFDVIMVEHRGVGMSRHDDSGADLPPEALTVELAVDDLAAVLDDAQVHRAVLYGTSYGTYLVAGMGVRHPDRVQAMVLDSPLLSADDIAEVRAQIRRVLWDGEEPGTAELADKVRRLTGEGRFDAASAQLAAVVYGLAGPDVLARQLDLLASGRRRLWSALGRAERLLTERKAPYRHEPDLVWRIGYRELNYGAAPDGSPLDPAVALRELAPGSPDFDREPYDLVSAMPSFHWPTVVLAGGRDLITPPAVAQRVAALIPGAVLVRLATAGHSALDFRERAVRQVIAAVYAGRAGTLADRAGRLDSEPPGPGLRLLTRALATATAAESLLPAADPHRPRQSATS